jgi:hypothetical protein
LTISSIRRSLSLGGVLLLFEDRRTAVNARGVPDEGLELRMSGGNGGMKREEWPHGSLPSFALDLGERGHELAAIDLSSHSLTLRLKAETACALAVSGDAVVDNERRQGSGHVQILNVGLDMYLRVDQALAFNLDIS